MYLKEYCVETFIENGNHYKHYCALESEAYIYARDVKKAYDLKDENISVFILKRDSRSSAFADSYKFLDIIKM